MIGAPQVIRRGDGYALINIDVEPLNDRERVTVAVQIYDQVMHLTKLNNEDTNSRVVARKAAELAKAASSSTVIKVGEMVRRKPDLLDLWIGGMGLNDLRRAGGYRAAMTIAEGRKGKNETLGNFGTSDKFADVFEILWRYLKAWEKRDFEYRHINPGEAKRRLKRIQEVRVLLDKAAEDIERRSHSATYSAPSEKKRRENRT